MCSTDPCVSPTRNIEVLGYNVEVNRHTALGLR